MAKKVWMVYLEDGAHTVELEHGYFSGKRAIRVDDRSFPLPPASARSFFDFGSDHPIQIGQHVAAVHIRTSGLTYRYDLSIDGRSVGTGDYVSSSGPVPLWTWAFVVACAAIPIVSLGGAIPGASGFGGAAVRYAIAKDDSKETATRALLCIGVTVLCWVLFIGLILAVRRAR